MPPYRRDYGDAKIIALVKEGTAVKKGDWIGQIDSTGANRYLVQKDASLEIARATLEQMIVQNESTLKSLDAQRQTAEASLTQAKIDTQRTRFEAPTQQEISRLQLKIAQIAFDRTLKNIEHTKVILDQDIFIQKKRIKQIENDIKSVRKTMSLFRLVAPGDGIVEYKKIGWHDQVKIKVGDEVRRGEAIVGIPDFSVMKAMTMVNEADIGKIERGQAVRIRLDAFPNVVINGQVMAVGQVCRLKEQDSKIKVFDVEVLLKDSQSFVRPGMTVSCEIITTELNDVLYAAHEYLYEEMGQYFLHVIKGGKTEKVPVKIGPRNNEFVVIYGAVKGGERLASRSAGEGV